jgi:hypothetical protein
MSKDNQISKFNKGKPIKAATLNQLVDKSNDKNAVQSNLKSKAPSGRQAIGLFEFVSMDGDFINCYSFVGDSVTTDLIKIAKPYQLRRTPFDGETYNSIDYTYTSDIQRSATQSPDTETQVVVPAYVVGDLIFAVLYPLGGTGAKDNSSDPVWWQDLNIDGRAWAKEFTE